MAYYQAALDQLPASCAFSMNLSDQEQTQALLHPSYFIGRMRRRIEQTLRRKLGRKVPFWFALEVTKGRGRRRRHRPHLHGALAISWAERQTVQQALCACTGIPAAIGLQYAVNITNFDSSAFTGTSYPHPTTLSWAAGYATKDFKHTRQVVVDPESRLSAVSGLIQPAKALYKHDAAVHAAHYTKVDLRMLRKIYPVRKSAPRKKKKTGP